MAMPSAVTLGSLTFVLAAAAGMVAVSADAIRDAASTNAESTAPVAPSRPSDGSRPKTRPAATPTAPAQTLHHRDDTAAAQPDAVPRVFVEVYNNSGISGLAAQKAAVLQGAGWNVAATDNWYGNIPANTVYYPPQLFDAAKQLAKVLGVERLRPAVAPMQFDRLTVIFTSA